MRLVVPAIILGGLVGLSGWAAPVAATGAVEVVESIVVSTDRVQAGTAVHVTTTACPTPATIEFIGHRTTHPMSKGLPPYAPLEPAAVSLVHDGSGVSFWYVPTEARTWEDFEVVCSDGTDNITAEPVAVFPPEGEAWWAYNTYEQNIFHADPGYVFFLGIRTIECEVGGTATASIEGYDAVDWNFSSPVPADGIVEWDVDIPADIHEGHYVISFACTRIGGGTFTAETFVVIGQPELVESGGGTTLLSTGTLSIALGTFLLVAARRRRPAATT